MKGIKFVISSLVILILPSLAKAEEAVTNPWKSYQKGVDFYLQRDYDKAGDNFLKSLNTNDHTLEQLAVYNLGNTAFEKAQAIEKQDPATAFNFYQEALEYYRRAIIADHRDKDAKFNYELTAKKLKELDQQQNKENKQKSGQDQNKPGGKNSQADKGQTRQNNKQQDARPPDKQEEQNQLDKPKEQTAKERQGQQGQQQQMSKDEALMLLNNFQRSAEKPKALIMQDKQSKPTEVDKDW